MGMRHLQVVLALFFLCLLCTRISFGIGAAPSNGCRAGERQALFEFKHSLNDRNNRLSSWVGGDCCSWSGVICSNRTGHVIKLDLRDPPSSDPDHARLGGQVNPSLLRLKHLNYLDLSSNDFYGTSIPKFIGSLSSLRYLNFSYANFNGRIPDELGNLSNLQYLDFNYSLLYADNLRWLSRLSSLKYVDMSSVDMTGVADWFDVVTSLSSLEEVRLSYCNLMSLPTSHPHLNSTSLATLDLSGNLFNSKIPDWFSNLTSLVNIDLTSGSLHGPITVFGKLPSLKVLKLGYNDFEGSIPVIHSTSLATLDLSYNLFNSPIPDWFSNLSSLVYIDLSSASLHGPITVFGKLPSLKVLKLAGNHFDGSIPMSIGNLCKLEWLDLSYNNITMDIHTVWKSFYGGCSKFSLRELNFNGNQLSGYIPDWLGEFKSLVSLELRHNKLNGSVPESLGQLSLLVELDLSSNQLNGSVPESLGQLSELVHLDLTSNQLHGLVPESLGQLSELVYLDLSSNQLNGSVPESLGQLSELVHLDLSSNQLHGLVPESLGQLSELVNLDLSSNQLHGLVSDTHFTNLRRLKYLYLSSNSLVVNMSTTWVPQFQLEVISLRSCKIGPQFPAWLLTQREFISLSISNAGISDKMPDVFWNLSSRIYYLNLSHNQISGIMPMKFPEIEIVDLSSNLFHGPLPHLESRVEYLDLSDNLFSGTLLPISHMTGSSGIAVSGNRLSGSIPLSFCEMTMLTLLDISNNSLSGEIPNCWKESSYGWSSSFINFANNNLSGVIPDSMGKIRGLESLHLNNNSLHGEIPSSLRNCTKLVTLDLGENRLTGKIPTWMGDSMGSLRNLRLRSNKFDGSIPTELTHLTSLQVLDLAHNNLTGNIPLSFGNFTAMAKTDMTNTSMFVYSSNGTIHHDEELLVSTKGSLLEYTKILALEVSLDLSGNNLSGGIPEELTHLYGLKSLNLSDNHLVGQIPAKILDMKQLESLDLSRNLLTGEIPSIKFALSFLGSLNLSYNNLSGRIPLEGQFQAFSNLSYIGNPNLCGQPLPKCPGDTSSKIPVPVSIDEQGHDMLWLYLSILLGFAVGFSSFCFTLLLSKSWRITYFHFIDDTSQSLYIEIARKSKRTKKSKGCNCLG